MDYQYAAQFWRKKDPISSIYIVQGLLPREQEGIGLLLSHLIACLRWFCQTVCGDISRVT